MQVDRLRHRGGEGTSLGVLLILFCHDMDLM